jgi:hypothetical protein
MVNPAAGAPPRELAPLVKRADEIQPHHQLMAYYCECCAQREMEKTKKPKDNYYDCTPPAPLTSS